MMLGLTVSLSAAYAADGASSRAMIPITTSNPAKEKLGDFTL
jgi:hypothetical protein